MPKNLLGKRERGLLPHAEPKQSLPLESSPVEYWDGEEVVVLLVQVVGLVGGRGAGVAGWGCGVHHWCGGC